MKSNHNQLIQSVWKLIGYPVNCQNFQMQDYITQEQVKIACNQAKSADNNNHGPSGC